MHILMKPKVTFNITNTRPSCTSSQLTLVSASSS